MEIAFASDRAANETLRRRGPAAATDANRARRPDWPSGSATLRATGVVRAAQVGEGMAATGTEGGRSFDDLAALSPPMQEILRVARRLAATGVTVTLTGETGVGKDVLAHAIHQGSPFGDGPFVVFDCGAVPPTLVESELYGHERGAFTGALAERVGAFERARGGTLFLDEIGELPLELQPRLLRVLDDRSIRRVGGSRDRQIDVRIVAATNRDLPALVAARQFRQDLYFRLAAAVVNLPALRDRPEDLDLLARRILRDLGRADVAMAPETIEVLRAHPWPGNVRELKNTLSSALAFLEPGVGQAGTLLEPHHLRFAAPAAEQTLLDRLPLGGRTLESLERTAIRQTLLQTRGNKVQTARTLGIAVSTLYEKLKRYDI
jgi:DNA-binding NtrC family response regulator